MLALLTDPARAGESLLLPIARQEEADEKGRERRQRPKKMGGEPTAAVDGDALAPQQHGSSKYDVLATIGEGAYGTVLRARDRFTGEIVAIKRIRESDGESLFFFFFGVFPVC